MAEKRSKLPAPAPVSDLLSAVFQGTPTERRLKEGRIWLVWDSAVGEQIANRARPVSFRDGTLTIAVTSAPWMQQLSFLKKGIANKLNSLLGEELVRDIFLKAGKAQRSREETFQAIRPARPLSSADRQRIEDRTASIEDPDLRQAVAELLKRHLESHPS